MLATINVPYKGPDEPLVFSYHYKYEKYLRDNNLIDPDKAKQQLRKQQMKEKAKIEAQKKDANKVAPPILDGEDVSGFDNDDSYPGG